MKIPKIIYSDKILNRLSWFMRIGGITLYPWIIIREDTPEYKLDKRIRHETIHIKQQGEMLVLPFYIWYGLEYFIRIFKYGSTKLAYENISFEREAYSNDMDINYLDTRKPWAWLKYL